MFTRTGNSAFALPHPLCNLLLFKLTWVLLVVWQNALLLPATTALLLSLWLHPAIKRSVLPALRIAFSGLVLDQVLTLSGVFVFTNTSLPNLVPIWLLLLWLVYGQALTLGLAFLQKLPLWAQALCGAVCGAGSYSAGLHFGAVQFGLPLPVAVTLLAVLWAVLLPLHLRLARGWSPLVSRKQPAMFSSMVVSLLALALLLPLAAPASANDHPGDLQLIGQASFRFMFWQVYDASLYAEGPGFRFPDSAPFQLQLVYKRAFNREQILAETQKQWRLQGLEAPPAWEQQLAALLPDVAAGDTLSLHVESDFSAALLHNGISLGRILEPDLSIGFAGIWLAANTTRPDFRQQLLGERP